MQLTQATAYFKALGEPIRLRLMHLLIATLALSFVTANSLMPWKSRNPTSHGT